jgi:type II secretory pathway pseudopilin PulG
MRDSIFGYIGNLDTLIAVAIGAILATGGALIAELIQDRLNVKRRERDAARFFGEILSSVDRILDFAFHTQTIGDKWGSVSKRMFRMALREAGVYERNRERLFDIRDMGLRTRIHTHFLVETFPIEAIIEYCDEIEHINDHLNADEPPTPKRAAKMKERLNEIMTSLEQARLSLQNEHAKTEALCAELEKIADVKFETTIPTSASTLQTGNDTPEESTAQFGA